MLLLSVCMAVTTFRLHCILVYVKLCYHRKLLRASLSAIRSSLQPIEQILIGTLQSAHRSFRANESLSNVWNKLHRPLVGTIKTRQVDECLLAIFWVVASVEYHSTDHCRYDIQNKYPKDSNSKSSKSKLAQINFKQYKTMSHSKAPVFHEFHATCNVELYSIGV